MPWEILRFLVPGRCVSGGSISEALGISRAAVWKRIGLLRRKGFDIGAIPSKGYLLRGAPDLSAEAVKAGSLGGLWREILYYEHTASTNDLAGGIKDLRTGTVIVADSQDTGRGRLGRRWISPPGVNIYMSLFIRPALAPCHAPLLTVLAAVSSARAVEEATGLAVLIKWPNDLTLNGKKLGGILVETRSDPDRIIQAAIGIGINVNMDQDGLPADVRGSATSLVMETGRRWERSSIIAGILREFERRYDVLTSSGKGQLMDELRSMSSTLGRKVQVSSGEEVIAGEAVEIDDDGLLVLRLKGGELRRISAGDITLLR